ncbi:MAG: hypothetical protein WCP20_22905 [Desulfuromonadales bacterium]
MGKYILAAAAICLLPVAAMAIPQIMSYQGKLNDKNGVPVNDSRTMTFSMYSSVGSPNPLWSETKSVPVASGAFSAELGTGMPLPDSMFRYSKLYLGIKVGEDSEMTPRQRVTSGAFSFRSYKVEFPVVPVGSVMAWMKSPNVPALSDGWVECNGQKLIDTESPLNNQFLPNLNGENRFLRGNSASGTSGGSDNHSHGMGLVTRGFLAGTVYAFSGVGGANATSPSGLGMTGNTYGTDTKPLYYDVVWIMKIK